MSIWTLFRAKYFDFREQLQVKKRFYPFRNFAQADHSLLRAYKQVNPFRISKEFLLSKGEKEIHLYGETPLTTLWKIAKVCGLSKEDTVIEMGAGRGRSSIFFSQFFGCQVRAYEQIPYFCQVLKNMALPNLEVFHRDMLEADFRFCSVIFLYGTCLSDETIEHLSKKFPKNAKIITVSYSMEEYSKEYTTIQSFEGIFPWGKTTIYMSIKQ